jgi:hypothetical protein
VVTERMLEMFKPSTKPAKPSGDAP